MKLTEKEQNEAIDEYLKYKRDNMFEVMRMISKAMKPLSKAQRARVIRFVADLQLNEMRLKKELKEQANDTD